MNRFLLFNKTCLHLHQSRHWLAWAAWLIAARAASAQPFPYMAYVTGQPAYVRSGPGQRYYPTGQLAEGFAVEVYRHDGEGWCAIRPPEGSFSWLASHQLRAVEAGIVEIVGDQVVARVGSALSPDRSAVQVMLPQGERLQMLAADEHDDPRWVRVAAPAGEFRWIAATALSRQPPVEARPVPNSSGLGWTRQSEQLGAPADTGPNRFDHLSPTAAESRAPLPFDVRTDMPVRAPAPLIRTDPNATEIVAGSPAELQMAQYQSQSAGPPPLALLGDRDAAAIPPAIPTTLPPQSAQPRVRFPGSTTAPSATVGSVEELELRLSQAVVRPPQQWELGSLETAANTLLAATKTPSVRAQLREVLQRIGRFQQVQQRYNDPAPPTSISSRVGQQDPFIATGAEDARLPALTGMSSSIRDRARHDLASRSAAIAAGSALAVDQPLYDAAGLLKPVVSKREQAPQYALVDEQGKVVSFVTPTPDLNLQPYLGRRIGVHGSRGFMPEYRRAHVTAGRVTPIEDSIRR